MPDSDDTLPLVGMWYRKTDILTGYRYQSIGTGNWRHAKNVQCVITLTLAKKDVVDGATSVTIDNTHSDTRYAGIKVNLHHGTHNSSSAADPLPLIIYQPVRL